MNTEMVRAKIIYYIRFFVDSSDSTYNISSCFKNEGSRLKWPFFFFCIFSANLSSSSLGFLSGSSAFLLRELDFEFVSLLISISKLISLFFSLTSVPTFFGASSSIGIHG